MLALVLAASAVSRESSPWETALTGFVPIAVFLIILFVLFRYQAKSPSAELQKKNIERHTEHMQRVENFLERIAKALEQRRE